MTTTFDRNQELSLAITHHIAGRYDEAEQIYLRLHQQNQRDEEVLYLIGVLCCDLGIFVEACRFLDRALIITPQFPEARTQLVVALAGLAKLEIEAGNLFEAERHLSRALEINANDGTCLLLLGRIALLQGNTAKAEPMLERALETLGNHVDAYNWLGLVYLQQDKYALADQVLRKALALNPSLSQARNNLGLSLYGQNRLEEARDCFVTALEQDPEYVNARINLANTLRILGQPDVAYAHLQQLLEKQPDSVKILNNLGTILQDMGQPQQALQYLERAIELEPKSDAVRWNLALSQLSLGEYTQGWANFEARWEGCTSLHGAYNKPAEQAWQGENLNGKRILIWAEQGFGDTLQFIRFASELKKSGAIVIAEVQAELVALLANVAGIDEIIAQGQALPTYDFHCPLMSLPHRLHVTVAELSKTSAPYIVATPEKTAHWQARLSAYRGLKIGLAWAGKSRSSPELAAVDARRSMKLEEFAPLLSNTDCHFFSLQKDSPAETQDAIIDFSAEWEDFSDTASFIANLDVIITVDTSICHLAGAMGKQVWLLNRYDTCWRWLRDRTDSPWYPTLRQFRQPHPGQWHVVIKEIAEALLQVQR